MKLLQAVVNYGISGISNKKTAGLSGLHRDSVSTIANKLEQNGLIKIVSNGRWRTYFPTENAIDLQFASIFSIIFKRHVNHLIFSDPYESAFGDLNSIKGRYLQKHFQFLRPEEASLLSFTVRNGVIITYALLRAMSPELLQKLTKHYHIKPKKLINNLVEEWVKNIISPVDLLREYSNELRFKSGKRTNPASHHKNTTEESSYELDQKIVDKLLETLSQLYPNIFRKIESVYNNLENEVEKQKIKEKKKVCNHEFKSVVKKGSLVKKIDSGILDLLTSKNIMDEIRTSKGIKEFCCNKCGSRRSYVLELEIEDKSLINRLNSISTGMKLWSSNLFRCRNDKHEWIKDKLSNYNFQLGIALKEFYECHLCEIRVELEIVSQDTVKLICDAVKDRVGGDVYALQIFNDLGYHFCNNLNKYYSSQDLDYLKPKTPRKSADQQFYDDKEEILKILTEYTFILREKITNKDDTKVMYRYIRKDRNVT